MHFPILTKERGKAFAGINQQNAELPQLMVNELQVLDLSGTETELKRRICELLAGSGRVYIDLSQGDVSEKRRNGCS